MKQEQSFEITKTKYPLFLFEITSVSCLAAWRGVSTPASAVQVTQKPHTRLKLTYKSLPHPIPALLWNRICRKIKCSCCEHIPEDMTCSCWLMAAITVHSPIPFKDCTLLLLSSPFPPSSQCRSLRIPQGLWKWLSSYSTQQGRQHICGVRTTRIFPLAH